MSARKTSGARPSALEDVQSKMQVSKISVPVWRTKLADDGRRFTAFVVEVAQLLLEKLLVVHLRLRAGTLKIWLTKFCCGLIL